MKRKNGTRGLERGGLVTWAIGGFIACVLAMPVHGAPDAEASSPFTSSPRGHILVPVSIDGSEPLVFVLDTGAARTFVTPDLVARRSLHTAYGKRVTSIGMHGTSDAAIVKLGSVTVGDAQVTDIEAVVLGMDHVTRGNWHLDGVLGMDFLTQFDVRLDFASNTVGFYPKATDRTRCIACPAGAEGTAFETIDPGFIVMRVTVDAEPLHALLDTGSGHSGLNGLAASALGVTLPSDAPAAHGFGLQTGPVLVEQTLLAERAALHVMDHPVMESLGLADRPTMLMGTDSLADRVLTISYGLQTLFFQ